MSFLERFFGESNAISWADLQDPESEARKRLEPFLGLVERGATLGFLPRAFPASSGPAGKVRWYFLCRDAAAGRRARDLTRSFLGPSFVETADTLAPLDAADPVEAAVLEAYGPHSYWVAIPSGWPAGSPVAGLPKDVVRVRLQALAALLSRRPLRTVARRRPVGRVLRDFEFAVTAGDVEAARACLAELSSVGDVSAANRQFLSVRIDGLRRAWDELLSPERVDALLDLVPPRAVVQVLVDGLYERHLQEFDGPGRAAEGLERFKGLRPVYGRLFRSRAGLSGNSVEFCFSLEAALTPGPAAPSAPVDPAEDVNRARVRFEEGNLDEALRLALRGPRGFGRTSLLIHIAAEIRTLESSAAALDALRQSSKEDLDRIARSRLLSEAVDQLRDLASGRNGEPEAPLPASWLEWLELLELPQAWSGAVTAAMAGEKDWDLGAATASPEGIDRFTLLLGHSRPEWGQQAFRDGAPFLVRALVALKAGAELRPAHEAIFLQLVTDKDVSTPQWAALADLLQTQVAYGLDASSYAQQLDALGALLADLASPQLIAPTLTLLEGLCEVSQPSKEALLRFATSVHAMLSAIHRKVQGTDRALFASLARSVGLIVPLPPQAGDSEASSPLDVLRGKMIALYSLNPGALERARVALLAEVPGLDVRCFSDTKGGGSPLAHAAKNADLFVIATAAATHAATGFIEQQRGNLPKRRVHRQGAAALLNEVRAFAIDEGGASC